MNRHLIMLAYGALAASACAKNKPVPSVTPSGARVQVNEDFRLAWHQEAAVADTPYRIRFADVVEDSRCAPDVQCVWAGRVRIALAIALQGSTPVTDTLAFVPGGPAQSAARYGNLVVRFVGYEPPPARSNEPRPPEKALALLRVERSGE